ncbi:MAG: hypothetical protein ACQEP1_03675 [Nanobdellota archaeon]
MEKIILTNEEPDINADSLELASVIVNRLGLMPRKKGSTEDMNKVLIELYERSKLAGKNKSPTASIMTVEEMATFAGITRQTMYDYLKRWLQLDLIVKTSYIDKSDKVVIGYKLNGPTLESAFEKAKARIENNLEITKKYILELQKATKNEKLSKKQR